MVLLSNVRREVVDGLAFEGFGVQLKTNAGQSVWRYICKATISSFSLAANSELFSKLLCKRLNNTNYEKHCSITKKNRTRHSFYPVGPMNPVSLLR
jgi:hypothetical protein